MKIKKLCAAGGMILLLCVAIGLWKKNIIFEKYITYSIDKNCINVGDSFYEDSNVKGKLKYTVNSVKLVTDISAERMQKDHFSEDTVVVADGKEYPYPDFFSGSVFVDGVACVLLDVTVFNEDAKSTDRQVKNEYLFRADSIMTLIDKNMFQHNFKYYDINYFSRMSEQDEHSYAYELYPGEEINFQIGYVVDKKKINSFYGCDSSGNLESTFLFLGLGGNENET